MTESVFDEGRTLSELEERVLERRTVRYRVGDRKRREE